MNWKELPMSERAKYIKLGLNNGITDLNIVRDTYNKYAMGGSTDDENAKLSFTNPNMDDVDLSDLKEEHTTTSANNANTQATSFKEAYNNYLNSPVVRTRLQRMYDKGINVKRGESEIQYIEDNLNRMKNNYSSIKYTDNSRQPTFASNNTINIGHNRAPGVRVSYDPTIAHEVGHIMYPQMPNYSKLYNIKPTDKGLYTIYGDNYDPSESGYHSARGHDFDTRERIPFLYETREDMRKLGIWDYTSGKDLTPIEWERYKRVAPKSRLGNYTKDQDAIDLLNTIAYNPMSKSTAANIAGEGGDTKNHTYVPTPGSMTGAGIYVPNTREQRKKDASLLSTIGGMASFVPVVGAPIGLALSLPDLLEDIDDHYRDRSLVNSGHLLLDVGSSIAKATINKYDDAMTIAGIIDDAASSQGIDLLQHAYDGLRNIGSKIKAKIFPENNADKSHTNMTNETKNKGRE